MEGDFGEMVLIDGVTFNRGTLKNIRSVRESALNFWKFELWKLLLYRNYIFEVIEKYGGFFSTNGRFVCVCILFFIFFQIVMERKHTG